MNASGVPKETNARHIENKILRSYLEKRTAIEVAVSDAIVFDFGQCAEHGSRLSMHLFQGEEDL